MLTRRVLTWVKKLIRNLKISVLLAIFLISMFNLAILINPAESATIGTHQVKAYFYKAYVFDDHDSGLMGAGEWYFYLRSPKSSWTSTGQILRDGPGYCSFDLIQIWGVAGGASTWCETWAREKDPWGWDSGADSQVHWTLTWPSTIPSTYYKRSMSYQVKDVKHYITYYIYNNPPTRGSIAVEPPYSSKDLSREASIYKGFPTTFLAKDFTDKEGDSLTYEWIVDGQPQTTISSRLRYPFTAAGSHTIKVRAKDSLSAYSTYATKTINTVMYKSYAGFAYGWCTYYASLEFDKYGFDNVRAASPGIDWHGNAANWLVNARSQGWATSTNGQKPVKGAIVVWHGGSAGLGHVAIVMAVYIDGITVREMNWVGFGVISTARLYFTNLNRGASGQYVFTGYIYPWKL